LLYLPPYSPDYSPIENCWLKLKTSLRKAKARTRDALDEALKQAIDRVTDTDDRGWFKYCGYASHSFENCFKATKNPLRIRGVQALTRHEFTAEEQSLILEKLSGQERNLLALAFWAGMRTSGLIGLEWGDIDFQRGTVQVQRSLTRAAIAIKREAETPTTKPGRRDVKLLATMQTATRETARIAAANGVLDRTYGKPTQAVEVTEAGPDMSEWSTAKKIAGKAADRKESVFSAQCESLGKLSKYSS
jgi:integrase